MVSPRCSNAANLSLVNPLLDRWKADAQLQGRIARLQQFFIPFRVVEV